MARTIYRVIYLIVLMVVLARLLICPAGREEEHLPVTVLIALHVREFAATARALWRTGGCWQRRWKRRRQDRQAILHTNPSWRSWIAPWPGRATVA